MLPFPTHTSSTSTTIISSHPPPPSPHHLDPRHRLREWVVPGPMHWSTPSDNMAVVRVPIRTSTSSPSQARLGSPSQLDLLRREHLLLLMAETTVVYTIITAEMPLHPPPPPLLRTLRRLAHPPRMCLRHRQPLQKRLQLPLR